MTDEVIEAIRETLYIKEGEISARTPITRLVRDSIDMVELVAVLSDRFQVSIDPDALRQLKTVRDIQAYVSSHRRPSEQKRPF